MFFFLCLFVGIYETTFAVDLKSLNCWLLKALKDGDSLMDVGKLKEALPFYEEIMNKIPFQVTQKRVFFSSWVHMLDSLAWFWFIGKLKMVLFGLGATSKYVLTNCIVKLEIMAFLCA